MTDKDKNTPHNHDTPNIFPQTKREQRLAAQDKLKNLCALLADSLHTDMGDSAAALGEQASVLNALFHTIISDKLNILDADESPNAHAQDWLKLALQIQRQCVDTVKTERTVQYMEGLSALNASKIPYKFLNPSPAPIKNDERTEGE